MRGRRRGFSVPPDPRHTQPPPLPVSPPEPHVRYEGDPTLTHHFHPQSLVGFGFICLTSCALGIGRMHSDTCHSPSVIQSVFAALKPSVRRLCTPSSPAPHPRPFPCALRSAFSRTSWSWNHTPGAPPSQTGFCPLATCFCGPTCLFVADG